MLGHCAGFAPRNNLDTTCWRTATFAPTACARQPQPHRSAYSVHNGNARCPGGAFKRDHRAGNCLTGRYGTEPWRRTLDRRLGNLNIQTPNFPPGAFQGNRRRHGNRPLSRRTAFDIRCHDATFLVRVGSPSSWRFEADGSGRHLLPRRRREALPHRH